LVSQKHGKSSSKEVLYRYWQKIKTGRSNCWFDRQSDKQL
jgi:hypothetical protein